MQKQKLTLATFIDLTRFEFTLFGLPFILVGALLPFAYFSASECMHAKWIWLLPAFLSARISGMAFNQLIDFQIDALNPRTSKRALPSGRAIPKQARYIAWASLGAFLVICLQINGKCFICAPFVAGLIYIYSYLKRVSWLCHFGLGAIHFFGPFMASLAIGGQWIAAAFWMGLAAACSIAGNDIVYAIQDYHFDKKHRLYSAPAYWGISSALKLSQALHMVCVVALLLAGFSAHLRPIYFIGPALASLVLVDFHAKVKPLTQSLPEVEKITPLFAKSNVTISILVLVFVALGIR